MLTTEARRPPLGKLIKECLAFQHSDVQRRFYPLNGPIQETLRAKEYIDMSHHQWEKHILSNACLKGIILVLA